MSRVFMSFSVRELRNDYRRQSSYHKRRVEFA